MEKIDSFTAKADLTYFISLALQKELSWNALAIVLEGFKLSNEQYKNIVKLLLKELEQLQDKLESKDNQVSDYQSKILIDNPEIQTDIKLEDNYHSNQDLYENEDAVSDTEDCENELQPDTVALETKHKKVIDIELVNENTAERFDYFEEQNITSLKSDENDSSDPLLIANEKSNKVNPINNRRKFRCVICTSDFTHKSNLISHERIHSGEHSFNCKTCPKSFTRSITLRKHERIHTGEKPFQCKVCKKSFNRYSNLKRHDTIHIEESERPKPYQCKLCPKAFTAFISLQVHERTHTGEKPFQCKTCFKSFAQKSQIMSHIRIHTGEKPYECNTCSKAFSGSSHLKRHKRIHSGHKPYKCNTCSKEFSVPSHLKRHEKIHTGEKPFQCKTCTKAFGEKRELDFHERIHSGERPFQCEHCDKCYPSKKNLKRHEISHSNENQSFENVL